MYILLDAFRKCTILCWIFKFLSKSKAVVFTYKILCPACVLFKQHGKIASNGVKHNEKDNNIIRNQHSNTVGEAGNTCFYNKSAAFSGIPSQYWFSLHGDLTSGFALILSVVFGAMDANQLLTVEYGLIMNSDE